MLDRVGIVSGGCKTTLLWFSKSGRGLAIWWRVPQVYWAGGAGGGLWHGGAPRWIYLQKGWAFWQGLRLGSRVR